LFSFFLFSFFRFLFPHSFFLFLFFFSFFFFGSYISLSCTCTKAEGGFREAESKETEAGAGSGLRGGGAGVGGGRRRTEMRDVRKLTPSCSHSISGGTFSFICELLVTSLHRIVSLIGRDIHSHKPGTLITEKKKKVETGRVTLGTEENERKRTLRWS